MDGNMGSYVEDVSLSDLHMHTTASDGTLSPHALINAVLTLQTQKKGPILRVIAVTDHDTLDRA
jgi:predicted metal-dependent phosphoesterase TrpH